VSLDNRFTSQRARIAALSRWAEVSNRSAATKSARDGFLAKFEQLVDPEGKLHPVERERRASLARRAHMARLALRSAKARAR
jgi:hypothetical protein